MAPAPLSTLLAYRKTGSTSSSDWLPPQACSHTLVTDTLASPALFLLVEFLKAAAASAAASGSGLASTVTGGNDVSQQQQQQSTSIVWLAADGAGHNHLSAVARRAGVNLAQLAVKGRFTFIDAAEVILDGGESDAEALRALYARVEAGLPEQEDDLDQPGSSSTTRRPRCIVIIDDVSSLLWSMRDQGNAVRSIGRWIIALRSLCARRSCSLVTLQHFTTASRPDSASTLLFHRLLRSASTWIEVKELSSGRARDCSGEIAVHPLVQVRGVDLVSPAAGGMGKGVLYNVGNDGSVVIWAKGTQGTA